MIVEKLIETLQEMDPSANVVLEGKGDTCWTLRAAVDDESGNFVMLTRGKELPVIDQ